MSRLMVHDHGVLCTVHPERGVDAVPVVYAIEGDHLGVPIDRVKPKASTRLQRQRNVEADPRATLLIEHWDRDDWSQLWWVRAELRWCTPPGAGGREDDETGVGSVSLADPLGARLADLLVERYAQYADRPFAGLLVFEIDTVTGWSASDI